MGRALLALGFVGMMVTLVASEARADVVGPDAEDCTAGTEGTSCHGGPYCRPLECMADTDCDTGSTCKALALCAGTVSCAGNVPPDADLTEYQRTKIEGTCPNGNECTADATCKTLKVCVSNDAGSSSSSGSDGGCACGEARGASTGAGLGAIACGLGVAVMISARRRQGRASRQRRA
ncbi:hypothetical protein [Polyangium aurulentum]|uniref:hypothetical protein n=1 Tax=Polyangium aurulentum TaxID=2567896 RepID=UPI0010ADF94F|nr:hypothetical protein [Polyangium aurulentum]UQA62586.1 hypothetical protein E8A73_019885 [Polyangium aurulentum]